MRAESHSYELLRAQEAAYPEHVGGAKGIEDSAGLAAAAYEARLKQHLQVLRCGRLTRVGCERNLPDRLLSAPKHGQDPYARGIGERSASGRDEMKMLV